MIDLNLTPLLAQYQAHLLTGLLLFVRLGALLFSMPMLGERSVPVPIKVGLSAAVAVLLAPLAPQPEATDLVSYTLYAGKEAIIGLMLGWVAGLFFSAVHIAGDWLDLQGGFQAAQLLNPAFNTQSAPLGTAMHVLSGLIFFGTGGCALMMRAVAKSVELCPCGTLQMHAVSVEQGMLLVTQMIWLAIQMAAPVAGTLFLAEIALALVNRAMPQMNAMFLALPAKGLLALGAMALTMPVLTQSLRNGMNLLGSDLTGVLRALAGVN